ncbi:NUDIX hydrolase [Emticicia oligotrophica DSM 17448]|uniref:NUDIX hydrolase n=1 Tax=Emticicia oligotrophica (strain DSM 17448 / CIP 109782 / MTCC 6937 / GPTSA100-15) TaxID=929562 RepID=A0ABN4AKF5_EMTOG|nr:NUDIX domain-containing protein [Emticicia oligotrophica]AFK02375.1 NUDIX hydrolase [Emticicia oligotrophica DSM 17448]
MTKNINRKEYLESKPRLLPSVSIDCVIFGFSNNQLKILLLKFKNTDFYALPGGFISIEEDLSDAALRVLEERTGLRDIYLEQFYVFGSKDRRYDQTHQKIMEGNGIILKPNHFLLDRFISIGYYALIDFSKANPAPDDLSDSCEWYDLDKVPSLVFDHNQILQKALETLRSDLDTKLVGFNLLPETFTINEIQRLYETILGEKLVRSNFQRKILSLGILERIEKKMTGAANKAPYVYRFVGQ